MLEVELVGFDHARFDAEVRQIKEAIFERAVAEGISEPEAREIAEIQAEEIAEEIVEFKKKANEVEALAREAKEASSVEVSDQVDSTLSPDQVLQAELLLTRPLVQSSETEDMIIGCLDRLTFARLELSPREQVEAMIPRNKAEAAMQKATLLRYDMEDFIARHPDAAKWCGRIFIGSVYTLQFAEYAGVAAVSGPIGVGGRFAIQETAGHAIENGVDASSKEAARLMTDNPTLQQEFADTIKCTTYAGLCIGSAKASKKLVSTLAKNALLAAPKKIHNHHIFPQKFKPFFEKAGIIIDDHCVTLGETTHLSGVHGVGNLGMMPGKWNFKWKEFITNNPNATPKEIYQFGGRLLDEFGLSHLPIIKYK